MVAMTEGERLVKVETAFKDHVHACEKAHIANCDQHKIMTDKLSAIYRHSIFSLGSVITLLVVFLANHLTT